MFKSNGKKKWCVARDPIYQKAQYKNSWHIGDNNGPSGLKRYYREKPQKLLL